jgi:ubiquitin carboxyl-terminal hydrolase 22/27/51
LSPGRKRKHEELFSEPVKEKEDPRYISSNTTTASCRASGLRGIYNAGATCYQNVVLQSFLHNPMLRNYYLSDGHKNDGTCEHGLYCLSCAMDDTFQEFYASETTNGYTAANILSGFWISERKAFENLVTTKEQDAHEFFQFLAEELHERNGDGKKPEIGSEHSCNCIIHQTFYGKLQSTTTCQHCNGVTNQVQSFLDLSLPLENLAQKKGKKSGGKVPALSLQECLEEEYIKSDKCEYRCHNCNSTQQARRQTSIKRLPNVLSIQLKVGFYFIVTICRHLQMHSDSSTNKAATSGQPRSRRRCSSHCSLTCCRTQTGHAVRTPRTTTSSRGHAPTTS